MNPSHCEIIIEVEAGNISNVYSSNTSVSITILDRDLAKRGENDVSRDMRVEKRIEQLHMVF